MHNKKLKRRRMLVQFRARRGRFWQAAAAGVPNGNYCHMAAACEQAANSLREGFAGGRRPVHMGCTEPGASVPAFHRFEELSP